RHTRWPRDWSSDVCSSDLRPGAAPVDILGVLGPQKDALRAGVARDHPRIIVIGMVGQRFDRDEISRLDRQDRFERPAEITPMHRSEERRGGKECRYTGRRD